MSKLKTLEGIVILTHIFNNSVETGITPEDWKSAGVTAIHKQRKQARTWKLYRPISVTSVVCKTMERSVKGRLITHL